MRTIGRLPSLALGCLLLVSACGSDDDTPPAATATGTAAPSATVTQIPPPTATEVPPATATATEPPLATPTEAPTATATVEPTPTATPTEEPTATATVEPTPTATPNPLDEACTDAGGTVTSGLCCLGASDFPNTCGLGACGCAPAASHEVSLCACPSGTCWNGETCFGEGSATPTPEPAP